MFIRLVKYHLLIGLKNWHTLFWIIVFPPLILGNLFHLTIGNLGSQEIFHSIPVAYVAEEGADEYFPTLLATLEKSDSKLIKVTTTTKKNAEKLLTEDNVVGIFFNGSARSLMVKQEGIKESILSAIVDEYEQKRSAIERIALHHPQNLQATLERIETEVNMITDTNITTGNMDNTSNYFYALIAMGCLYGSFLGVDCAIRFKANLSYLGARRMVATVNRFTILFSDVCAQCLLQISSSILTLFYLIYILKVEIQAPMLLIFPIISLGSIVGVLTGMCIGALGRSSSTMKSMFAVTFTLTECFLSGLMVSGMYHLIAQKMPIINRINPAALIVDSFYSLSIYDTYSRYIQNILSLLIVAALLCIGSYFAVRRERYASI
jgi:ABC-2 type transport system permease protein